MTRHTTRGRWAALAAVVTTVLALGPTASGAMNPVGMVCTDGTLAGNTRTFDLVTGSGDMQTPDGNAVFMWSYSPAGAPFQTPGPVLCANAGETIQVNLTNNLLENSSIIFPGQDSPITYTGGTAGLLTNEAAPGGGTVSYSFTASQPGTYIYESGTNIAKQIEMGLYGAIVIRPAAGAWLTGAPDQNPAHYAYADVSTHFNSGQEYMLLLAEIDPDMHHAVATQTLQEPFNISYLHNHYYTINGRSFPDTIQRNATTFLPAQPYGALVKITPTAPGEAPALIRMLNVGTNPHPFHPHGNHTVLIGQDGRELLTPGGVPATTEHFAETIGTGQTQDFTIRWDSEEFDPNRVGGALPDPALVQPNYVNLTFKDSNTWYSGDRNLGGPAPGTNNSDDVFPVGTTSQNICGEWYFPFHSHALNEFSNYDEGFGGMGTLLRVDPRAGCTGALFSLTVTAGARAGSTSTSLLATKDSRYLAVRSTRHGAHKKTALVAEFRGIKPKATRVIVTYVRKNSRNATTSLAYYNWRLGRWVTIASGKAARADRAMAALVPTAGIGTGANAGRVRVRVIATGRSKRFTTYADLLRLNYTAP
jgi:hypothetical protein